MAGGETIIGAVEEVILLPWGVRVAARIDTGAAKSSLAACDLVVRENVAEFQLPEQCGGMSLRLPVVEWRTVRNEHGSERRPVVEMELCIGSKRIRTKVNLNDRGAMKYPFLVGRNTLEGNFVVDVRRAKSLPPLCEERPRP
jgi:hypothetical protein